MLQLNRKLSFPGITVGIGTLTVVLSFAFRFCDTFSGCASLSGFLQVSGVALLSVAVVPKVKRQLDKRKRRRFVTLFIAVAIILIIGAVLLLGLCNLSDECCWFIETAFGSALAQLMAVAQKWDDSNAQQQKSMAFCNGVGAAACAATDKEKNEP